MIYAEFPQVEVLRVIDGDTIEVDLGEGLPPIFRTMSIRVKGIDAPEQRAKRECERKDAALAKSATRIFIGFALVDLWFCEPDKYWRLGCHVMKGNKDLSEHLLKQKLAYPYGGGTKVEWGCK